MRLRALAAASMALFAAGCGSQSSTSTSVHRASSHHADARSTTGGSPAHTPHDAGDSTSAPPPVTDRNGLRRAATKLQAAPGFTFKLSASLDVPSFGGVAKLTGNGSFDTTADAGSIDADVTPPGILSLLGEVETQVILNGNKLYMLMPDSLDGTPIGGKAWGKRPSRNWRRSPASVVRPHSPVCWRRCRTVATLGSGSIPRAASVASATPTATPTWGGWRSRS